MELDSQLAHYIVRYYADLMTDVELKAQRHLFATMKATKGRSDETAQRETQNDRLRSRWLSAEPDVLSLAKDGYQQFQLMTAARILRDSAGKVFFNTCPVCGALARTPSARQCRYCGHDWH
jgi:hypothetical protein